MINQNIVIENARIGFRNFSGKEGKFNPAGRRNFCLFLDNEMGTRLEQDGWNVRWLTPKDDDEEPQGYLQVSVNFGAIPPKVVLVTKKGKTQLSEESAGILDWAELQNVDLIVRPYNWEVNGRTGTKAYLKAGYFTIVEDEFADKYADCPDSAVSSFGNEH